MTSSYSKVLESFVEDDTDISGLIAYGLYKFDKRAQIIRIKNEKNRTPSKQEVKEIETILSSQIDFYKKKANEMLDGTLEYSIERNKEEVFEKYFIQTENLKNEIFVKYFASKEFNDLSQVLEKINKNTTPKKWISEIWIEVQGNIAWTLLLIIISVIAYFSNDDMQNYKDKVIKALQPDSTMQKSND